MAELRFDPKVKRCRDKRGRFAKCPPAKLGFYLVKFSSFATRRGVKTPTKIEFETTVKSSDIFDAETQGFRKIGDSIPDELEPLWVGLNYIAGAAETGFVEDLSVFRKFSGGGVLIFEMDF